MFNEGENLRPNQTQPGLGSRGKKSAELQNESEIVAGPIDEAEPTNSTFGETTQNALLDFGNGTGRH